MDFPNGSNINEKVDLKLNIQKTKIMASDPITSWQIDGETVETAADFILGGSKIRWLQSWKKKMLAPLKKVMTKLDSILKSRDITLPAKVCIVKAPIVMYEYESQAIKKAEYWCFQIVVLEKTLESPLNIKEIKP